MPIRYLNINSPIMPKPGIILVIIHNNKNPLIIMKPNMVDPLFNSILTIYMFYIFLFGMDSVGMGDVI